MGKKKSDPSPNAVPWYDWLLRPFALDPRSLAAMRIGLGLVLLWDLANRAIHLSAMYTDEGVVPHSVTQPFYGIPWGYTPFNLSGEWGWTATLFGLMFLASAALLTGAFTRWVTPFLWLMVGSLHARLPLVNSGGDELLRMLLFWGIFLPWGDAWSIDARLARDDFHAHEPRRNFGTAGLVLQICIMYGMTALFKTNDDWYRGEPLLIAMRVEQWGTPLGEWLLQWPLLVRTMCWLTLAIEAAAPILILSPWATTPLRIFTALLFIGLHSGIELTLDVGQFSAVCISAWLAILPAPFWEWGPGKTVAGWMDGWTGTIPPDATADVKEEAPPKESSRWVFLLQLAAAIFCAGCIGYMIVWSLSSVPPLEWYAYDTDREEGGAIKPKVMPAGPLAGAMSPELRRAGDFLGMNQTWAMFAKAPRVLIWFAAEGLQADGKEVDLLRGGAPMDLRQKPANSATPFPNHRWQKMYRSLLTPSGSVFAPSIADYLLREANRTRSGEEKITRVRLIAVFEEARIEKTPEVTEYVSRPLATAPPEKGGAFSRGFEELGR